MSFKNIVITKNLVKWYVPVYIAYDMVESRMFALFGVIILRFLATERGVEFAFQASTHRSIEREAEDDSSSTAASQLSAR